jgi:redox-sensing transcriptional repressor
MADEIRPSRVSAARLSLYLRCLDTWRRTGTLTASSGDLAAALGFGDAQVRKDLSALGSLGRRGVGYNVVELIDAIRGALAIDREWLAVLIGVGNLAKALLRYRGFAERGFRIVGLFDSDEAKVGQRVDDLRVLPTSELAQHIKTLKAHIGIIAVPSEAAQEVANQLVDAGIRGVLNFAPTVLRLPESVPLVSVDLTIQLEQLAFLIDRDGVSE